MKSYGEGMLLTVLAKLEAEGKIQQVGSGWRLKEAGS